MNRLNIALRNRIPASLTPLCIGLILFAASSPLAVAQDVWTGAGNTDLWSDKANWSNGDPSKPGAPPDLIMLGPGHLSNTSDLARETRINSIQFPAGAPNFLLHIRFLTIEPKPSNAGIFNDSGRLQIIDVVPGINFPSYDGGILNFFEARQIGAVLIQNEGGVGATPYGATTRFDYFSSAGQATINNFDSPVGLAGRAQTQFASHSTAGDAVIANIGGTTTGGYGGSTSFEEDTNYDVTNAGNATIHNIGATAVNASGGFTVFLGNSGGGNATIVNDGTNVQASSNIGGASTGFDGGSAQHATITNESGRFRGGETDFEYNGTAGNALIINNGAGPFGQSGRTLFNGFFDQVSASAGDATIVNQGGGAFLGPGGETVFTIGSTAGNATLIANAGVPDMRVGRIFIPGGGGGTIFFTDNSTGGTAHVQVLGNGSVDISGHDASGVTIASINGDGQAFLGANKLSVGSDNSDDIFYGSLHDGGDKGGTGGSFTKVGSGLFALEGNSDYTGATTVNSGKLIVDGNISSSSGVTVNAGATLAGHGFVSSINGAGTIAPAGTIGLGVNPGILTATKLNPTGGADFSFEFTKTGSPIYGNSAASGNDVLHLMDVVPFTSALTSDNQITIDFSGASLADGQIYLGGFFSDGAIDPSLIDRATFLYLGLNGFSVQFDGFVTEAMADFAGGAITNGEVLQFEIEKGTSTVPDWSPSWLLLALALLLLSIPYGLRPTATR